MEDQSPRLAQWRDAGSRFRSAKGRGNETAQALRHTRTALTRLEARRARMSTEDEKSIPVARSNSAD